MHRLPLQLASPSISWDRQLPECIIFDRTLNQRNVDETNNFITILEEETTKYRKFTYGHFGTRFELVPRLIGSSHPQKIMQGLHLLNGIIIRAPKDSHVLSIALKMRGNWFFVKCCFEGASMDYEMFLSICCSTEDPEEMLEIHGNLVICYYLRRQYEKAKEHLINFNKYKKILPIQYLQQPNLERINRHILIFAKELDKLDDIVPKFDEDFYTFVPFKGFNTSEDIPFTSAACKYSKPKNDSSQQSTGVYANCTIPKGSVVLAEHPVQQSLDKPFVQCEICLQHKEHIYTCLECRYKTYCSLQCMRKDAEMHRKECIGYKYLILLILDATNLYRIFMRVLALLQEQVFVLKPFRKLTTATAVFEKLQTVIDEKNMQGMKYLKMLKTKPDYYKLSDMQYATLVTTAFRLTVFIEKTTYVIDSYFQKLRLSNKQKMILVGAILMRLNCNLLNNTFDFEFSYPLYSKKPNFQKIKEQVQEMSADGYQNHKLHAHNVFVQPPDPSRNTEQTQQCAPIHRQLSTYKDKLAEVYFNPDVEDYIMYGDEADLPVTMSTLELIGTRIGEMGNLERYKFVQTFVRNFHKHYADFFENTNLRRNSIQQVFSVLCTTLKRFRHSCDPNIEVMVLENGLVLSKALRDIGPNEELFVSYKAHYMRHLQEERKHFLQKLNIDCKCKYCIMSEEEEICNQRLGIFCDNCCFTKITPAQSQCPTCRSNYNKLSVKFKAHTRKIGDQIRQQLSGKGSDRDIYVNQLMSYKYAVQNFTPNNEFRIRVELGYAKFMAIRKFSKQAFDIIQDVQKNMRGSYQERFLWFSLYAEILDVVKIVLYHSIEDDWNSISNSNLELLCSLGLYIINGQLAHLQLYDMYDYESAPILQDLNVLLEWKEKIPCIDLLPLSDTSRKPRKAIGGARSKTTLINMPTLAKVTY